jgi:glycogen(starch) synthase
MNLPRVLHLTRDLAPRINGGLSTAVAGLVRATARAGLTCAVASFDAWRPRARPRQAPRPASPRDEHGLSVLRLTGPADLPLLLPFAGAFRPELVHLHHGMLWEAAETLRAEFHTPILKSVHLLQAETHRLRGLSGTNLSLAAQRLAIQGADRLHVPSRDAARALLRDHPEASARLTVLPFGIEDSGAARRAAAREAAFEPRVLFAGRFADVKGVGELILAWPEVAGRVPGARLCLAGGLPENRRAEARFRRRAGALAGLEWPGWLPPEALGEAMARAELLVAPGWFETFDLALLEGMLHGLPAVATAAGGHLELTTDGLTGLLVPAREPGALARALVELLGDPARARAMGRAAAEAARRDFLWERVVPRWLGLYSG